MNILNYFDNPLKKQNIEYFVHLIRIAKADDNIGTAELDLLRRIGRKLGFTDHETDSFIETTGKSEYSPPYEFSKRFEQIYDIVKMILADGTIDKNEMRLASVFARTSGFEENEIPWLLTLLIDGIRQGKDEEDLFDKFKKERKYRNKA